MNNLDTLRSFATLEEAYSSLPQQQQEEGVRAREYAKELFLQLCSLELYPGNNEVNGFLLPELADTVALSAKYLNIGKAMLPPLYHALRPDFTVEELAVYHAIPAESAKMVDELAKTDPAFDYANKKMVVDTIKGATPWWEELQTPTVAPEEQNILARVVAVATALNHYATTIHAEKPMDEALEKLTDVGQGKIDMSVIEAANHGKAKLRRVFHKFIGQSRAIPTTDSMIRHRASRPFSLYYRPVMGAKGKGCVAFECQPMVKDGKHWLPLESAMHIIKRENIISELTLYHITELCDTIRRLDTCQISTQYIGLTISAAVMNRRGVEKQVRQRMELAETSVEKLCVLVPRDQWQEPKKNPQENWKKLSATGIKIQLCDLTLEEINPTLWKEWGVTHLSFKGTIGKNLSDQGVQSQLKDLAAQGFTILVDGLEKKAHIARLPACNAWGATGIMMGEYQSEDETIRTHLAQ